MLAVGRIALVWAVVCQWGCAEACSDCAYTGSLLTYYINGMNGPCWPGFTPFLVFPEITEDTLFSGFTEDRYISGDEVATFIEVGGCYHPEGKLIGDLGPEDLFLLETIQIDVTWKAAKDSNYEITKEDIEQWICEYGMIPPRSFVIFNTGWSFKRGNRYYGPDTLADIGKVDDLLTDLLGTNVLEDIEYLIPGVLEFSWPGLSAEAAEFLYDHFDIKGIGIDTPSVDAGFRYRSYVGDYPDTRGVRRFLASYGLFLVQNLLLLDIQLPARGVFTTLGVFNMCKATRAPVNVYVEFCADWTPSMCCEVSDYVSVVLNNYPYPYRR
ncbi:uncharacterized protein LOC128993613 [Macrosteles quadrilineatus]|uniref:uncharacterized protein LOC128993613 n=1 Tax=Macrosteles quadrilineatus TaxID=74068 RepID=UPI0023E268EC|nr:uncharacterized protein LOC128993613 [Macrosteles quadrilineatus]